jgi:hypothetical protein
LYVQPPAVEVLTMTCATKCHFDRPEKSKQRVFVLVVIAAVLAWPGCDTSPTRTVSGKITYKGKPVTSGLINFAAEDGRPLGNSIRPDGTYACQLPPAEYQVRIDAPGAVPDNWKSESDRPPPQTPRQVPIKYSAFETSGLTATVHVGKDPLIVDFNLR